MPPKRKAQDIDTAPKRCGKKSRATIKKDEGKSDPCLYTVIIVAPVVTQQLSSLYRYCTAGTFAQHNRRPPALGIGNSEAGQGCGNEGPANGGLWQSVVRLQLLPVPQSRNGSYLKPKLSKSITVTYTAPRASASLSAFLLSQNLDFPIITLPSYHTVATRHAHRL